MEVGTRVIITKAFFASNAAKNLSSLNGYQNWKPVGIIKKNPSIMTPINSDNGPEWEIPDNYHVILDENPFIKGHNLHVTFLDENDIEKVDTI